MEFVSAFSEKKRPSEWCRAVTVFGVFAIVIFFLSMTNMTLSAQPPADPLLLLIFLSVGSFIAFLVAQDIWLLRVREWPLWVDVICYVVAAVTLLTFIYLRESGLFVWNTIYADALCIWMTIPITFTAWLTERRQGVRIYIGARSLQFVHVDYVDEHGLIQIDRL